MCDGDLGVGAAAATSASGSPRRRVCVHIHSSGKTQHHTHCVSGAEARARWGVGSHPGITPMRVPRARTTSSDARGGSTPGTPDPE